MLTLETPQQLAEALAQHPGLLLLIGGKDCGVCQVLKPKIASLLVTEFPAMTLAYIDCQASGEVLCGQIGVFSLPVVRVFFHGDSFGELTRVFSMADIKNLLERPYSLCFN
ncbi:thioredoxin family protein [Shewanella amazonensis]|uniref:Thioredoxin domain n=1 Tax=Shewanella amazonensis (strain ATCC BAA-1098 / SB2B) TaxID=326297 RepID=A1SBM9_SHEAM|nr:thioredoxin family protein [Shewanella amazonensis]ABM01786.1 thioredoxin domain [Shewanella amazonensis SB2B]